MSKNFYQADILYYKTVLYKFFWTRTKNHVIENRVMENRLKQGITVVTKFQPISELSLAKVMKFQPISELSLASDEISTNNRALVTLVLVHDHELTKH